MSPRAIEILIVEDHPVVCLGLRTAIDAQPDMRVVGESASTDDAAEIARKLSPDLVILPLRLEGELRGVELCRELKGMTPAPRVLVYTSYNSTEGASASFLSGADSYVHKGEDSARLLDTIRATTAGRRTWILGGAARSRSTWFEAVAERSGLTRREREVLGLLLQHLTNAQISEELVIELPTVKTHVSSILGKLALSSRRELFQHSPTRAASSLPREDTSRRPAPSRRDTSLA